jgi:hypothetical protein
MRWYDTRSSNVRILFETVTGFSGRRNASPDLVGITMKQVVAAQRRKASKVCKLRKPESAVDFFALGVDEFRGAGRSSNVWRGQTFSCFSGVLTEEDDLS